MAKHLNNFLDLRQKILNLCFTTDTQLMEIVFMRHKKDYMLGPEIFVQSILENISAWSILVTNTV